MPIKNDIIKNFAVVISAVVKRADCIMIEKKLPYWFNFKDIYFLLYRTHPVFPPLFNPIALRKAKIANNFGLSECHRVNGSVISLPLWHRALPLMKHQFHRTLHNRIITSKKQEFLSKTKA